MSKGKDESARRLSAVLTCHNRREKTLRALQSLHDSAAQAPVLLQAVLVDDGSQDGTSEAVRNRFPTVEIIQGSGSLFWNQGMRVGIAAVLAADPEYILLLNDDTYLDVDALPRLLATAAVYTAVSKVIVVGSTRDPWTGRVNYGGKRRSSFFHPLRFEHLVEPGDEARTCDVFNGNCVLIPRQIARLVGNLSADFQHALGDFDYGLRARAKGVALVVAPGTFGSCAREEKIRAPRLDRGFANEFVDFATHPKKVPWRERMAFYRRHAPGFALIFIPVPYVKYVCQYLRLWLLAAMGRRTSA